MLTQEMITDRQQSYLLSLLSKKDLSDIPDVTLRQITARVTNREVTKSLASQWIARMQSRPNKAHAANDRRGSDSTEPWFIYDYGNDVFALISKDGDKERVPRGSYALETPGTEFTNDITFFSVWISEDGARWSVKLWASDELIKLARATQYRVLAAISDNPAEAAELYGKQVGKCGICHRKLTNDISRARGIGPICAQRYGW